MVIVGVTGNIGCPSDGAGHGLFHSLLYARRGSETRRMPVLDAFPVFVVVGVVAARGSEGAEAEVTA